jgi:hypothetical protein
VADLTASMDVEFSIALPIDTPESTGSDKAYFPFAVATALTITEVYLMVGTAPGSSKTFTVDVNKNGTTIFTTQENRPSITDTNTEDTSGTPDVTALAKNDKLTVDVDVSTASTAVADAICIIRGTQAITHPLS